MKNSIPNLTPARWLWLPSERTLPNTFVLFRRRLDCSAGIRSASGWISADSRYLLRVNGEWVQWGPAPCDPRSLEADPVDLTDSLRGGENQILVQVLFYGHGEGTWVFGKPGFLFSLDLEHADGRTQRIVSDREWECALDPQRQPGRAKRWYLRALQEVASLGSRPPDWIRPKELDVAPDKPPICSSYPDYLTGLGVSDPSGFSLVPRAIPPMRTELREARIVEAHRVTWRMEPDAWFDLRVEGAFDIAAQPLGELSSAPGEATARIPRQPDRGGTAATFDLGTHLVGWVIVELEAPLGTIVDVMLQEAHETGGGSDWLDTHHHRWLRFTCGEGANRFEAYDYDSVRWIQVHVRDNGRPARISRVALRAREYDFAGRPDISLADRRLQRLLDACLRTVRNGAQETLVDCMGRERQQYSGDIGHEAVAVMAAFGEYRQPARYLETWSAGQTDAGYFLDCWPAFDRTNRIPQRLLGLTEWGPILDHGAQFALDVWRYHLFTGALDTLETVAPRLLRLLDYFEAAFDSECGYEVERLTVPSVWIDHDAYLEQRHKQCAYDLVVASALEFGLAQVARVLGDDDAAHRAGALARRLVDVVVARFWSKEHGSLVVNLPWLAEEAAPRFCDRSLAVALLCGYLPGDGRRRALDMLASRPGSMGYSYVPNQFWRHRALIRGGRPDTVVHEYRTEWASMDSVVRNATISEHWSPRPDSRDQYSHGGVVPLLTLLSDLVGVRPTTPAFATYTVEPRLADLPPLAVTVHTPHGPLRFESELVHDDPTRRLVRVTTPPGGEGVLVVPAARATGDAADAGGPSGEDRGSRVVASARAAGERTQVEIDVSAGGAYSPVRPGEYL